MSAGVGTYLYFVIHKKNKYYLKHLETIRN